MKNLECSGDWWLPHNKERKIAGKLTFSNQDGICLDLLGLLEEKTGDDLSKSYSIILGVTTDCKMITLCDCRKRGDSISWCVSDEPEKSWSYDTGRYSANLIFIGAHFTDPDEMQFYKARVQYAYLPDWVRRDGFKEKTRASRSDPYELTYQYPPAVKSVTSKGTISVQYDFHPHYDLLKGGSFRQSTWMQVELPGALTLEEWQRQYIYPLQNFIILATRIPNWVIELFVYSNQKTNTVTDAEGVKKKIIPIPIQVVFRQYLHEGREDKLLTSDKMIFSLQDIETNFDDIMGTWLEISDFDNLGDVCNLFFSVFYSQHLYQELEFLNTVFAAELYHRRRMKNEVLPKNEHNGCVTAILSAIPEEYKDWLQDILNFSNEPPFEQRINEVVDLTREVVLPLTSNRDYFVKKVKHTRNYHVHNDPNLKKKAAHGEELYWITDTLSYLVQTCLFREMGLLPRRCFELLSKNKQYKFAMKHASKFGPSSS